MIWLIWTLKRLETSWNVLKRLEAHNGCSRISIIYGSFAFRAAATGNSSYKLLGCGQLQAADFCFSLTLDKCWQLNFSWCVGVGLFDLRFQAVLTCIDWELLTDADWCWLLRSARPGVRTRPRGGSLASPKSQSDPILKSSKLLNSLFQDFFDALWLCASLCYVVLVDWRTLREREREFRWSRTEAGVTFCLLSFGASHGGVLQVNG